MTGSMQDTHRGELPSRTGGLLMGIGLGGFVDGIVLHQIFQWHHMLSDQESTRTVAGLEVNTLADGFFHAATWVFVLAGSMAMLSSWRRGRMSPNLPFHAGLLLAGWGLFNLVEGVVDHHVLQIHHVRDDLGGPLSWDLGFLVLGAILLVGGWLLHLRGARALQQKQARRAWSDPSHDS
jgi:uncharacterized membrane protein